MKVLLVNGSPHKEGCTYTALCEVSEALNKNGIDTAIFRIGNKAISGCIACSKACVQKGVCALGGTSTISWRLPEIITVLCSVLLFIGGLPAAD